MSLSVIETIRHAEPEWMLTASAASKDGSTLGQQHMSSQTDASCSWESKEFGNHWWTNRQAFEKWQEPSLTNHLQRYPLAAQSVCVILHLYQFIHDRS